MRSGRRVGHQVPPKDKARQVNVYLSEGRSAADKGFYEVAAAAYQKVIDLESSSTEGHFLMGLVCENLNNWDRAIDEYRKSVALDNACVLGHLHLGRAYALVKQKEDALREYENALEKLRQLPNESKVQFSGGFSAGVLIEICQLAIEKLRADPA